MQLYWIIGVLLAFENFSDADKPDKPFDMYDPSCHPGYKENKKAENNFNNMIKSACSWRLKADAQHCYRECIVQSAGLQNVDHLHVDDHIESLSQWFSRDQATKIANKVVEHCEKLYDLASSDDNGGYTCEDPKDQRWNDFYDCVDKVWKCKV